MERQKKRGERETEWREGKERGGETTGKGE